MSITDKIQEVKDDLKKFKRNRSFKKANAEREKIVELQTSLAKCRGKLEVSLKDFKRTIRSEVEYIHQDQVSSNDIALHEQLLWDSALGYMLIRDAIFALKTVTTYDSIEYGYELLSAAVSQMDRKKAKLPVYGASNKKSRNKYGYLTADPVKQEKIQILESIFDELKETGDIDACLARSENKKTGEVDKTDPNYLKSLLSEENKDNSDAVFKIDEI
ncbi:MAG: hypothetical protein IJ869_07350 [Clostridiales bacterium]|nr:hypothetical protein [Clostridiales bacterium]